MFKIISLILIILSSYCLITFFITLKISHKALQEKKVNLNKSELACMNQLQKLSAEQYMIIPDVMIKVRNSTTQIDFIIVSQYGIFVVEVKDINGFILADVSSKKWRVYYGKMDYAIQNPILQNDVHIDMLSKALNLDKSKMFSIICFSKKERLKFNDGKCSECIIDISQVASKIINYNKHILSLEEVTIIANKILSNEVFYKEK